MDGTEERTGEAALTALRDMTGHAITKVEPEWCSVCGHPVLVALVLDDGRCVCIMGREHDDDGLPTGILDVWIDDPSTG